MKSLVLTSPRTFVSPWTLGSMHRQLENWVDRALGDPVASDYEPRLALTPRIDFVEIDEAYELTADLPGLEEENLEISLSQDVLTLKGQRSHAQEADGRNVHLNERGFGYFKRAFSLPDDVDQENIAASLRNGVLEIHLPKSREATPSSRRIKVKTS